MIKGLCVVIFFWVALKYLCLYTVHLEHMRALQKSVERCEDVQNYSEFAGSSNQVP